MGIIDDLTRQKVRVTLLTNSLAANDVPLVHTAYARYRRPLLISGVELYELSPGRTNASLRFGVFGRSLGRLHAKLLTIDRRLVFIGSMNLDGRSARFNTEVGLIIDSPALVEDIRRLRITEDLRSTYRLRLAGDAESVEWVELGEDGREIVHTQEPDANPLSRFKSWLLSPFLMEDLL